MISKNYLDYIPEKNTEYRWELIDSGRVVIYRTNTRWMEKITQRLLGKPKITRIELEKFGTYIWQNIDGKNSVYQIAQRVHEEFGENAEPLYTRLVAYFRKMYSNRLIKL